MNVDAHTHEQLVKPDLFPSNGSLSWCVNLFKLASIIRIAAFTIVALLTVRIIL